MPEIKVLNMAGENVGTMTLSDAVFAARSEEHTSELQSH